MNTPSTEAAALSDALAALRDLRPIMDVDAAFVRWLDHRCEAAALEREIIEAELAAQGFVILELEE